MRKSLEREWLHCLENALTKVIAMPVAPEGDAGWLRLRVRDTQRFSGEYREASLKQLRIDVSRFDEEFPGLLPVELVQGPPLPARSLNPPDPPPAPDGQLINRVIMATSIESPSEHDIERIGDTLELEFDQRKSGWWGGKYYFARGGDGEKVYFYRNYDVDSDKPVSSEVPQECWLLRFERTYRDIEHVRASVEACFGTPVRILST